MNDDISPTDLSASATADPAAATHPHRPPRKPPRKRGPDRGLPAEADRLKLAGVYLELQRELWPQLVTAGVLPSATDAVLKNMSDDLARRHVSGVLDDAIQATLETLVRSVDVAGSYERYSCDNSSRRSIDDQLRQILVKAAAVKQFIPWALVFADASISGADPSRQGYSSLKKILGKLANVRTIYIDEFSRAGRDTLEWFRLAGWARKLAQERAGGERRFRSEQRDGANDASRLRHVQRVFPESSCVIRSSGACAGRRVEAPASADRLWATVWRRGSMNRAGRRLTPTARRSTKSASTRRPWLTSSWPAACCSRRGPA